MPRRGLIRGRLFGADRRLRAYNAASLSTHSYSHTMRAELNCSARDLTSGTHLGCEFRVREKVLDPANEGAKIVYGEEQLLVSKDFA